jgi:hypothetical protein
MTVNFAGRVYNDAGTAINGASVKLLETGTTTQEGSTVTTDSNGAWAFTESDQDRYDIEITSGSSVRRIRWDDQISLKELDVRNNTGATTPAATLTNLNDAVANQVAVFSGANATRADGDEIYISFKLADSAGNIDEFARITAEATDVTSGSEDGQMRFGVIVAGTLTDVFTINSTTGGATSISYEVDSFTIKGEDGGAGILYLFADRGDDAGDEWKINIADGGVLTFGNDIASAGTYVTFLTLTPHATPASSTVAIVGDATVGDDLSLTSDSSVLGFGADTDTTLTHTDGTGLTLNSTNKLTFGDAASFVQQSADGTLRVDGEAIIDLNASTRVDVSASLTVGTDVNIGDDLSLTSDSAVFNMGAGNDFTITHDGTTGATLAGSPITVNSTGALTLDSSTDITLDADGADVFLKDGGTLFGTLTNSSGELVIKSSSSGTTAATFSGANVTLAGTVGSGAITSSGIIKTDDATEATSTTDGSLQTDGGLSVVKDAVFGDDVKLLSDSAVLAFGADGDATLTHTNDTGITLNSTNKLMFNDASQFVQGSSATVISIGATDEIDLTATAVDLNGTLDVSGNAQLSGTVTVGADGSGTDVIFYSGTSGDNLTWDASEEVLQITGTNGATALDVLDGDVRVVDTLYFYDRGGEYMSSDGSTLAIVGNTSVAGHLLPSADDTYDLGSASAAWQDLFIEGDITLTDAGSIVTSAGSLTLDPATTLVINPDGMSQAYAFTQPGSEVNLALQAQSSGQFAGFYLLAADGDGTDYLNMGIVATGTPDSFSNLEYCFLGFDPSDNTISGGTFRLLVAKAGSGTAEFPMAFVQGSTVWMTKASATNRVGLFTTAPGAVLDVNSGAGNMIADGYDTHSLAKYKEGITAASGYLAKLTAVPAQTWTKKPFVSADSIKEATIEEFGKDAWEVYFPYDASHKNKALQNMEAGEMKTWIDAWAETQRVEFRKEVKWKKKNVGLVADATATLTNLPEVVSTDLEGNPTGIDTLSYVGVLHSALVELSKKVDAL